jgi:hypothetical protein
MLIEPEITTHEVTRSTDNELRHPIRDNAYPPAPIAEVDEIGNLGSTHRHDRGNSRREQAEEGVLVAPSRQTRSVMLCCDVRYAQASRDGVRNCLSREALTDDKSDSGSVHDGAAEPPQVRPAPHVSASDCDTIPGEFLVEPAFVQERKDRWIEPALTKLRYQQRPLPFGSANI